MYVRMYCLQSYYVPTRGHLDLAPSARVEFVLAVNRVCLSEPVVVEDGRVLVVIPVQNRVHPILCHSVAITHCNTSTNATTTTTTKASQTQYTVVCGIRNNTEAMGGRDNLPQYGMAMVGLMACKVCSTSRVKAV